MKNANQTTMAAAFDKSGIKYGRKTAKAPQSAVAKAGKEPNYTPEQEARMVELYTANPVQGTVEALALEMGKTVRSVVAKLSRSKVYVAKTYKTKTGEKVVKKDETADAIGAILQMSENEIESLTKATKPALRKIFEALAKSVPLTPDNDTAVMKAGEYYTAE